MEKINISAFGLAFGAVGQSLLLGHLLDRYPHWFAFAPLLGPWLLVYVISFCRVAPCTPSRFRQLLVIAMAWYSLDTVVCDLLWLLVPSSRSSNYSATIPHVLCYGCTLTFIVLIRAVRSAQSYQFEDPQSPKTS